MPSSSGGAEPRRARLQRPGRSPFRSPFRVETKTWGGRGADHRMPPSHPRGPNTRSTPARRPSRFNLRAASGVRDAAPRTTTPRRCPRRLNVAARRGDMAWGRHGSASPPRVRSARIPGSPMRRLTRGGRCVLASMAGKSVSRDRDDRWREEPTCRRRDLGPEDGVVKPSMPGRDGRSDSPRLWHEACFSSGGWIGVRPRRQRAGPRPDRRKGESPR